MSDLMIVLWCHLTFSTVTFVLALLAISRVDGKIDVKDVVKSLFFSFVPLIHIAIFAFSIKELVGYYGDKFSDFGDKVLWERKKNAE